jgi:adenosylcobinamide-phosphate synthase
LILPLAMLLDAVLGEPRWLWSRLPHPAVLMGNAVGWIDKRCNTGDSRKLAGALSFAGLVIGFGLLGRLLQTIPTQIIDLIILAMLLAQKSLIQHLQAVGSGLRMSLPQGRRAVAMIVSRDTSAMDQSAVARSAIESGSENLSDGIIAPAFWFAVAGLPGLLIYKITNTADSMIGYRTPRHADFGWAAAHFDDLLNWIPARLTAVLIWLPKRRGAWSDIIHDAKLHRSPNAGWPEAAMAHAHDIALAGPRSYDGTLTDFTFVNPTGRRDLNARDIDGTCRTLWAAWGVGLALAIVIAVVA